MSFKLPEKRLPDEPGWWARRRGGRVKWFKVEWIVYDEPIALKKYEPKTITAGVRALSVYMDDTEDFVPVQQLSNPLARWQGPVVIKDEE